MVRIRRSHRRGPGSIPGVGTFLFLNLKKKTSSTYSVLWCMVSPSLVTDGHCILIFGVLIANFLLPASLSECNSTFSKREYQYFYQICICLCWFSLHGCLAGTTTLRSTVLVTLYACSVSCTLYGSASGACPWWVCADVGLKGTMSVQLQTMTSYFLCAQTWLSCELAYCQLHCM